MDVGRLLMVVATVAAMVSPAQARKTQTAGATTGRGAIFNFADQVPDRKLYSFQGGGDGFAPVGGVIVDKSGNVFGTTIHGGNATCFYGCGTVFELVRTTTGYQKVTIHEFDGTDSAYPVASLTLGSDGILYGSTSGQGLYGGSVFELIPNSSGYRENVLHLFGSAKGDGASPGGGRLVVTKRGEIYGTTTGGGASAAGTVYKLEPKGSTYKESILYSLPGGLGGTSPYSNVLLDANRNIIAEATEGGAHNDGLIFELSPGKSGYTETVLHDFAGSPSDGALPQEDLLTDDAGDLFGVTVYGGRVVSDQFCTVGCGTVFELQKAASGYREMIIHNFRYAPSDGQIPVALARGSDGSLFGTTLKGGRSTPCQGGPGCGVVFSLTPSASGFREDVLHRFRGNGTDGNVPESGVFVARGRYLYGTTAGGGTGVYTECGNPTQGCGTVFRIDTR